MTTGVGMLLRMRGAGGAGVGTGAAPGVATGAPIAPVSSYNFPKQSTASKEVLPSQQTQIAKAAPPIDPSTYNDGYIKEGWIKDTFDSLISAEANFGFDIAQAWHQTNYTVAKGFQALGRGLQSADNAMYASEAKPPPAPVVNVPSQKVIDEATKLGVDFTTKPPQGWTAPELQQTMNQLASQKASQDYMGNQPIQPAYQIKPEDWSVIDPNKPKNDFAATSKATFDAQMARVQAERENFFSDNPHLKPNPKFTENVSQHPELLANPQYWAYNIAGALPTVAVAMLAVSTGGAIGGGTLGEMAMAALSAYPSSTSGAFNAAKAAGATNEQALVIGQVAGTASSLLGSVPMVARLGSLGQEGSFVTNAISNAVGEELAAKMASSGFTRGAVEFTTQTALQQLASMSTAELNAVVQSAVNKNQNYLDILGSSYLESTPMAVAFAIPGAVQQGLWGKPTDISRTPAHSEQSAVAQPQYAYHGTTFDKAENISANGFKVVKDSGNSFGDGVYLTTNEETAKTWAGNKDPGMVKTDISKLKIYDLDVSKPEDVKKYMELSGETDPNFAEWKKPMGETLGKNGYDGVRITGDFSKLTHEQIVHLGSKEQVLVFDSSKIGFENVSRARVSVSQPVADILPTAASEIPDSVQAFAKQSGLKVVPVDKATHEALIEQDSSYANKIMWRDDKNIYIPEATAGEIMPEDVRAEYLRFAGDALKTTEVNKIVTQAQKEGKTIYTATGKGDDLVAKVISKELLKTAKGDVPKTPIVGINDYAQKLGLPAVSDAYYTGALMEFAKTKNTTITDESISGLRKEMVISKGSKDGALSNALLSNFKPASTDTITNINLQKTKEALALNIKIDKEARADWKGKSGEIATNMRESLDDLTRYTENLKSKAEFLTPADTSKTAEVLRNKIKATATLKGFMWMDKLGHEHTNQQYDDMMSSVTKHTDKNGKIVNVSRKNMTLPELEAAYKKVSETRPLKINGKDVVSPLLEKTIEAKKTKYIAEGKIDSPTYQSILGRVGVLTDKYVNGGLYITEREGLAIQRGMEDVATVGNVADKLAREKFQTPENIAIDKKLSYTGKTGSASPETPLKLDFSMKYINDFGVALQKFQDTTGVPIWNTFRKLTAALNSQVPRIADNWAKLQSIDGFKQVVGNKESLLRATAHILAGGEEFQKAFGKNEAISENHQFLGEEWALGKKEDGSVNMDALKEIKTYADKASPAEKKFAQGVIDIFATYRDDVRYNKVLQGIKANIEDFAVQTGTDFRSSKGYKSIKDNWIVDAPEKDLFEAVKIYLAQGEQGLRAYTDGKSWGVRDAGYLPTNGVTAEVKAGGQVSGTKTPHPNLMVRRDASWASWKETSVMEKMTSYMHYQALSHADSYVKEMGRLFQDSQSKLAMPQDWAKAINTNLLVMEGRSPSSIGEREFNKIGGWAFQIISMSPRFSVRNMLQPGVYLADAIGGAFRGKDIGQIAREFRGTFAEETNAVDNDVLYYSRYTSKVADFVHKYNLYPITENFNRKASFNVGYMANREVTNQYLQTGDLQRWVERSGIRETTPMERDYLMGMLDQPSIKLKEGMVVPGYEAVNLELARLKSEKANFLYTRGQRSLFEQGTYGKAIGNLSTYPRNVVNLFGNHIADLVQSVTNRSADPRQGIYAAKRLSTIMASTMAAGWAYGWVTGESEKPDQAASDPARLASLNPFLGWNPYNPVKSMSWSPGGLTVGAPVVLMTLYQDLTQAGENPQAIDASIRDATQIPDMYLPVYREALDTFESATNLQYADRLALRGVRASLDRTYNLNRPYYDNPRTLYQMITHAVWGTTSPVNVKQ